MAQFVNGELRGGNINKMFMAKFLGKTRDQEERFKS